MPLVHESPGDASHREDNPWFRFPAGIAVAFCCFALLVLLAWAPRLHAATLAVCEAGATAADGQYAGQGQRVRLWHGDGAAPDAGCDTLQVPVPAAAIRWVGLADGSAQGVPPQRLVLQGDFNGPVRVSEIDMPRAGRDPQPLLPMGSDILSRFTYHTFGVEERAALAADGSFACAPGLQPAGVQLRSDARWTGTPQTTLQLQVRGSGELQLAIADAGHEAQQTSLPLADWLLQGEEQAQQLQLALPQHAGDWSSLVLLCPATAAVVRLDGLQLLPRETADPRIRSAWLWSPALWRQDAPRMLGLAEAQDLDRLYLTVPVAGSRVANAATLRCFLRRAHAAGLEVWPVVGDPRDVLDDSLPALLRRVEAYLAFNRAAPSEAQLVGLQLDIEPHLLPGFSLDQDHWRQRYLQTVHAVQGALAGRLALDLVLPVWWGTHAQWGSAFLAGLKGDGLSVTIMNYRTDPAALQAGAQPFLAWGQRQGVPVAMALEAGSVGPDEERRHYERSDDGSGELLWLQLGGRSLLVLLDGAQQANEAQAYRLQRSSVAGSAAISFAGDLQRLAETAAALEPQWRSWSSYAGLALHGLDELLLRD